MSRRGHLSHKVPNVKLRPAPPTISTTQARAASQLTRTKYHKRSSKRTIPEDSQEDLSTLVDEEDAEMDGDGMEEFDAVAQARGEKKPLEGLKLCLTGLREQKSDLTQKATSLGATVDQPLTMDVTHVIAETVMTPKYKVAIEYGIKVMLPSWIETLHSQYLNGEPIDLHSVTLTHALPPLHNLQIAITGFPVQPPEIREALIHSIAEHGATFRANYSETCTHLLIGPELDHTNVWGNHKVQMSQRFRNKEATCFVDPETGEVVKQIREGVVHSVVWSEWLEDSIRMGGALQESGYVISQERQRIQRILVPKSSQSKTPSPQKLLRQETTYNVLPSASTEPDSSNPPVNAIKRTRTENEESEIVNVKKRARPNGTDSVKSILGFAPSTSTSTSQMEIDDLPPPLPLPCTSTATPAQMNEKPQPPKRLGEGRTASFASTSRPKTQVNRFLAPQKPILTDQTMDDSIQPDDSGFQTISPNKPLSRSTPSQTNQDAKGKGKDGEGEEEEEHTMFFRGVKLWLRGMVTHVARAAAEVCEKEGAVCFVNSDGIGREQEMDWIVVPLLRESPHDVDTMDPRVVSDVWLERSLFLSEIVDPPDRHFAARPMPCGSLSDAAKYNLSYSGFDECDREVISRICDTLGIKHSNSFNLASMTHILTVSEEGRKAQRAREAGIAVVGIEFLLGLVKQAQAEKKAAEEAVRAEEARVKAEEEAAKATATDAKEPQILDGCVITISKKISHNRQKIVEQVNTLGGRYAHSLTSDVTHFLHSSQRNNETFVDFKNAKKQKKFICHPQWLDECQKNKTKVNEKAFPHTWSSNRQLNYLVPDSQSQANRQQSQSRSATPSASRRSSAESQQIAPGSDEIPPPLDLSVDMSKSPAPTATSAAPTSVLAEMDEMSDFVVPPRLQQNPVPADQEAASSATVRGMNSSSTMPPPSPPLISPADVTMEAQPSVEVATPVVQKSSANTLTVDMLDRYRALFETSADQSVSSSSGSKPKRKVRPLDRRRSEMNATNGDSPSVEPTNDNLFGNFAQARPLHMPFGMTQTQPTVHNDFGDAEESMRIVVVDPAAAKARAELLGQVYAPPTAAVLDLSPPTTKRRAARKA